MNLTLLAPDIQEQIQFLPAVSKGRDPLKEWQVRPVAAEAMETATTITAPSPATSP